MGSEGWRHTAALISRILFAILAAALLLIQVLAEFNVFRDPTWLPVALAVVVAMAAVWQNSRQAVQTALAPKRDDQNVRVQKAVYVALSLIAKRCHLDIESIGASVFRVERRIVLQKKLIFPLRRVEILFRPAVRRFRLNAHPQPTSVEWTTGKGAIGQVWKTGAYTHVNWSPIAKRHGGPTPISKAKFAGLPAKTTVGFSYDEFVSIVGKYGEILAVPIMSDGGAKILGVIAIDRPYDSANTVSLMDDTDIRQWVTVAAAAIAADL